MLISTKTTKSLFFVKKINRLFIAWLLVISFFLISISGLIYSPWEEISARISNRNYNGEGLIEFIEAICWISAFIVYFMLFSQNIKTKVKTFSSLWLFFFMIFCFVAFGEEISWGQHIFGYASPEIMETINQQNEVNFHNLNLSEILGLSRENPLYRYLKNFTTILNPLFYLVCGLVWVVFPVLKKGGVISDSNFIGSLPVPALGTIIFCGMNMGAYLVIDKLFFDVGEIFELSLSLVAIMSALDLWEKRGSLVEPTPAGIPIK